jgi:AAA+ ATPase superfamily predicted ATPase
MAEGMTPAKINGFDKALVRGFAERIDTVEKDMASEKGLYMRTIKGLRADIALIYDEAKEKNIPKKELKAAMRKRRLIRQAESIRDNFDDNGQGTFDALWLALDEAA